MPDEWEMLSLGRYLNWSTEMHRQFQQLTTEANLWGIPTAEIGIKTVNASRTFQFVSYWFASLYVVIEGWRTLRLSDPDVDRLLSDEEKVATLRRYRNGVFHFQRDFYDTRFSDLLSDSESMGPWIRELSDALRRALFPP